MERGMSVTQPVEAQFAAYNAHDPRCLRGLLCPGFQRLSHADRDAEHSRQGALRAFYAQHRFNNPLLKAELLSRTVLGNKVFDHEKIHGLSPSPSRAWRCSR